MSFENCHIAAIGEKNRQVCPHQSVAKIACDRRIKSLRYFILCYFAIISTRSISTEMANNPGTKLVEVAFKLRNVVCSRSPKNLEFGYFTLLLCRGQRRNVPKCKTHVQSDCFCSLNLLFCGVVVVVAVVVA